MTAVQPPAVAAPAGRAPLAAPVPGGRPAIHRLVTGSPGTIGDMRMPAPRVVRRLLAATVAGGVVLAGLLVPGAVGLALVARGAPAPPTPAALPSVAAVPAATTVLDRDGHPIAVLDEQYRIPVPITAIAPAMRAAAVAIEDRRFFDEPGVDPVGTARALVRVAVPGQPHSAEPATKLASHKRNLISPLSD